MLKILFLLVFLIYTYENLTADENTLKEFFSNAEDVRGSRLEFLICEWTASDLEKQRKSREELSIRFKRGDFRDIPDKLKIYKGLLAAGDDLVFIKDSIGLLAEMPVDEKLLKICKKDLQSADLKFLMGALAYLEIQDNKEFSRYFLEHEYGDIPLSVRRLFSESIYLVKIREKYFYKLIKKMSELPDKKSFVCDAPNEGYNSLLKCNENQKIIEYINCNWEKFQKESIINASLLALIAEINSSMSVNNLLEYYLKDSSFWNAITLAACLDKLQVSYVLDKIVSAKLFEKFIKDVVPDKQIKNLKDKDAGEKIKYFIDNFDEIKKHAKARAQPQLG